MKTKLQFLQKLYGKIESVTYHSYLITYLTQSVLAILHVFVTSVNNIVTANDNRAMEDVNHNKTDPG